MDEKPASRTSGSCSSLKTGLAVLHQRADPYRTLDLSCMKKIGFLSCVHGPPPPRPGRRRAVDPLLRPIDLAVEAERWGREGAYFGVHHFARQLASPSPLLGAIGTKTQKIKIGTAVIDMRY